MSCVQWVDITMRDCVSWAETRRDTCVRQSSERVRRCTGWATSTRQECQTWHDEATQTCTDWGTRWREQCCTWQPCSWFCNTLIRVAETVCVGWTTITTAVCQAYVTVVERTCQAWEWIVRTTCAAWATIVSGVCSAWGWAVRRVCAVLGAFTVHISSSDDEPRAPSTPRLEATSMSIARVAAETAFVDSGTRFFFRIRDGRVEVRTIAGDWHLVEPEPGSGPEAISYHRRRLGETVVPERHFDMIAADSGRVFVKERGRARFFFTMLDPMFRREGNTPVPSAYFKLDPEQGLETANNADRVRQLPIEDDSDHPAAVRFPLFRRAMEIDLNDSMVVNIDPNLEVWHRIDARPPKDAPDPPDPHGAPGVPPTAVIVTYEQRGLHGLAPTRQRRRGYRIVRALDIGVGHEHWHEQRCRIYGGEMDSLDGPGLRFVLRGRDVYRMFNGPVEDQGGFIDGTVNYYVLAQFLPDRQVDTGAIPPADAFAILWLDEQAVLSERWRLVSPDDSRFGGFRDIIPSAMVQYMDKDFVHFRFDRTKFWDPMRSGHVTRDSRMAISRQVIVLSGSDPASGEPQFFTINFSFGTSDRTWRWRSFPPKAQLNAAFDLREDMTLFVRETDAADSRYWYQRYLPASGRMTPDGHDLLLPEGTTRRPDRVITAPKPASGFRHPWQWLPADLFEFVHARFSHFGCYEDRVNWRWQYYRVDLPDDEVVWRRAEDTPWTEQGGGLSINKASLNWPLVNTLLAGDVTEIVAIGAALWARVLDTVARAAAGTLTSDELAGLLTELEDTRLVRHVHTHGLFHDRFVLKLLYREPLGWILVHWDKRDDDLLPFRDMTISGGTPFDLELAPGLPPTPGPIASLHVNTYHQVLDPPAVEEARVLLLLDGEGVRRLRIELRPAAIDAPLGENIWRIKLGALRRDASTDVLIGAERLLDEIRVKALAQDVPRPGWHGYEWDVGDWPADRLDRLKECCSEAGRVRFGTSLWFENVVGHVAPPESIEYGTVRRFAI